MKKPTKPTCVECRFWEHEKHMDENEGLCHRFPPPPGDWETRQPSSGRNDWCGEFEERKP